MAKYILDASVALAWCLDEDGSPLAKPLLESATQNGVIVPALWHIEIANILLSATRRKRITKVERKDILHDLGELPIERDETSSSRVWTSITDLADTHSLSAYDATYLELAIRKKLPLATFDKELRAAAKKEKIRVLPEK